MEAALIIFFIVVALGLGALWLYFSADARFKRALRNAKRVRVADCPDCGNAKFVGTLVYADETLIAPLTGRRCAFYEVIVEEYRSSGDSSHWYQIIRDVESKDFFLEDSSGRALVRVATAEVMVVKDSHSKSGSFDDATDVEEAFLKKTQQEEQGLAAQQADTLQRRCFGAR